MRVLLSAYACEPYRGSEPEVGLQALLAAATRHDVWLLTRKNNIPKLEEFLIGHPDASRIRLCGIEGPAWALALKRIIAPSLGIQLYYSFWQRKALAVGRQLDAANDFDVVHHVTLATYWARAGMAGVGKPFIWGPVGGGVEPPRSLLSVLGWRGFWRTCVRLAGRRLLELGPNVRQSAGAAWKVIAQNPETAFRITAHSDARSKVRIFPNGIAADPVAMDAPPCRTADIVFVGRLIPWKAANLAVEALAAAQATSANLVIIGEGPERDRVAKLAAKLGIAERVHLVGSLPRREVMCRVATASALIHPALHEESGMAVAEALALGTPVICLDWGGPRVVGAAFDDVAFYPIGVSGGRRKVVGRLAMAIDAAITGATVPDGRIRKPRVTFADFVLSLYDDLEAR